jgi:hypothetical protein
VKGAEDELAMVEGYAKEGCVSGRYNLASVLIGMYWGAGEGAEQGKANPASTQCGPGGPSEECVSSLARKNSWLQTPAPAPADRPLLLNERKVDFRIYAFIASTEPFMAFVSKVFMARRSPKKYSGKSLVADGDFMFVEETSE